jgi:hypothetical protein
MLSPPTEMVLVVITVPVCGPCALCVRSRIYTRRGNQLEKLNLMDVEVDSSHTGLAVRHIDRAT